MLKLPPKLEQFRKNAIETLRKAEAGDKAALDEVRELAKFPDLCEFFKGNLHLETRNMILGNYCENPVVQVAVKEHMNHMRTDLAGDHATPLELALVERILTCWLHLHTLELRLQHAKELSFNQSTHLQEHIDRANRRYLKAITSLANVRKVNLTIQFNLAKKQVNVNKIGRTTE